MFSTYKNSAQTISLLILLALGFAAAFAPHSTGESVKWPNIPHTEKTAGPAPRNTFGRLPLSFEPNQGQTDARVKFLARGHGYALFLTDDGAVFSFSESKTALHMRLQDAATSPRITGDDQLPGKVNYLLGNKSSDWRTDIPTYARVRYEQIYPGVDLVYYGNQRQLEYDFVVQPGASFRQIRLAFDDGVKLTLNRRGELILKSGAHKLTLLRPKAYQEIDNQRREVSVRYSLKTRGEVGFQVGNYDKSQPLVIDPLLVYSTFLGGSGLDVGKSIAADSSGNAYIAGQTSSLNFPTSAPLQATKGGGTDAFVAKLNANGSALIYSTFIGGTNTDSAASIAVDTAGNAYLTGQTSSANFPVLNALHPTLNGGTDAFVAELNSAGSALVYSTYLGGRGSDVGNSIAIDAQGNAYVAGNTSSTDFPTTNPLQANRLGHSIYKSTNGAGNWAGSDLGLAASVVFDFAFAPNNSSIMYAAAETGLFKTTDGGTNWNLIPTTSTLSINKLAIDPTNPAIIYAAASAGMFKSTDGGNNFTAINNGFVGGARLVLVDPVTPTTLYGASFGNSVFKSVNAGASWTSVFINDTFIINGMAIDPNTPSTLYAAATFGLFKSTNSGVNWTALDLGLNFDATVNNVAIDKTTGAIYAATIAGLLKSVNGGTSWTNISESFVSVSNVVLDPTNSSIIYITNFNGPTKSSDGGATWTVSNTGYPNSQILSFVINPTQPATLFIGTASGGDAFVTKLSAGGTSQIYSTYLGGSTNDSGFGIALDGSGNAYVTGLATSGDFPTANATQPINGGGGDAFITKLNPSGSALVYSTFLGAEGADSGRGIAVDASDNAYICGSTNSLNFPVVNAFQPVNPNFVGDAFVAKVNTAGSAVVYATYLGGQGVDDCASIAVDAAGSVYVTGNTNSTDFPTVAPLPTGQNGAGSDAFITKFAPNGASLIYSTYLGGADSDGGSGIAVDSSQNVYLVGSTSSTDFPTLNPLQPTRGGSSDLFVAKLRPAPDVQVTLTDTPDPVDLGSNLTYTIDLKNVGELPATGVTVTDALPAGSTFVSISATAGIACSGTTSITCNAGTLNAGATGQISIVVKPPAVNGLSNTVNVTLNEADAIPTNNSATAETTVRFTDVSITKKTAQSLVAPGGKLIYSLSVKNNGPLSTTATVTDNLPAGTSLIKCVTTTTSVCGQNGNTVTAVFNPLDSGASASILMIVGVSASASEGAVINNTASVVSTIPDPNTSNDSSSASATVAAVAIQPKSNGLIAFVSERSSGTEPSGIYTVKPDGTDEKVFPNIPNSALEPSWSPDGTKLAFLTFNSNANPFADDISVVNADGTGLVKVATDAVQTRMISWSPNGSQIAYVGGLGGDISTIRTVHIANIDGSGSYGLPGSPSFLDSADWSPDGSKFVYALNGEIYVMNADATGQTKLTTIQQTPNGPTSDLDPRWSPDGTKIMLLRFTCCSSAAIHVMNADGSNLRKLFTFNAPTAAWSPDGVSIVAQMGAEICRVNLDNTNFKCLTNDSFTDRQPSWQRLPNPNPTPTPTPQPTFTVTGKLTTSDGSPPFAQMHLTGAVDTFPSMDPDGNFEFVNLPPGQYTITPISNFHTFEPQSRSITITNANITGQNFVATFAPSATVTGHVKDSNGNPLGGIQITIGFLGSIPQVRTTDANGLYSFANVPRNSTVFINPDPLTPYDFVPSSKILNDLATTEIVDFVGTLQPTKVISGRVIEAISGQGIGGVPVNLSQDISQAGLTVTDANGNFSFGARKMNHHYGVSVPSLSLYLVEPRVADPFFEVALFDIPSLTSDQNLTFTAAKRNTVQFSAATAAVNESSGFKEIVVTRAGDLTSAANVDFATADTAGLTACSVAGGKASERCDYGSTAGTLRFAAGEASKSIFVPIVNDANVEGDETFKIALSGPVGAQMGSTANVTVTIIDNDTTPATQNPIDAIDPFVTQQYIDFLGRLPDSVGFANWVATLNGCPNSGFGENDNPNCDRVHVSAGFFQSDEFRGRGYWAYRFYEVAFDRRPLYAEFVPDMAQVGGAQSPQSELLSKAAYTDAFVQRGEFTSRYNSLSNAAYVNALEQNAEITLADKAGLIAALDNNQKTRGQVLREIVESAAVEDRFFIRAFVAMQYFGYLRRDPDTIGYNNWVTTLTNDPSNFRHMIFGFLFSNEYRGRFGP